MTDLCTACGATVGDYDRVEFGDGAGGSRLICLRCYNATIAECRGLQFEHVEFDPITLQGVDGRAHTFAFRTRIFSDQLSLDALETVEDGYEFSVIADAEQDLYITFQRLFERMRRELARQHVELDDDGYQVKDSVLRGHITSDLSDPRRPLFIIDGRPFTLEELGDLVSPFQSFRFKLELFDRSEER